MNRKIVIGSVVVMIVVVVLFIDVIPPKAMTVSAMTETAFRIKLALGKTGAIPSDLAPIPSRTGYANRIKDGWGRPLIYEHTSNTFTLTSLGKDGRRGGTADNLDITKTWKVVFPARTTGTASQVELMEIR